jgi:cytochrome c biogenesis protein CcdA
MIVAIASGSNRFVTQPSRQLQIGLAFVAGIGLTLMVVVAGVAVVDPTLDSGSLGILFAVGVAMLISGIIAWFAVVRPDTHFDDINVPMYHGHDHHDDAHAESDTPALAEHH